jgi:hypothetical protein
MSSPIHHRSKALGVVVSAALLMSTVLAMSAPAFASASPQSWYACTSGSGAGEKFVDANCTTPAGGGAFEWAKPPIGTAIKSSAVAPFSLTTVAGGVTFNVACSNATFTSGSTVEDHYQANGTITGSAPLQLSGCAVTNPKQCQVPSTIMTNNLRGELAEAAGGSPALALTMAAGPGSVLVNLPVSGAACPSWFKGVKPYTLGAAGRLLGIYRTGSLLEFAGTNNHLKTGAVETSQIEVSEKIETGTGAPFKIAP